MALWVCGGEAGCGTKYAVGLFRCPRCHNEAFYEDGDPMGKISRNGGASAGVPPVPDTEDAAAAETVPAPEAAADQPEVAPLADALLEAGMSVETAAGLVGGLPKPVEAEEGEDASPAPDYEAWTVEQLKEQLAARNLPKSGKRDDLVLRLLEDDDTRTSEAGTE